MSSFNLLTMIPKRRENIRLKCSAQDPKIVFVQVPRTNFLECLSIKYLKQPTHHEIKLDELGSFVIQLCDGFLPVHELERRLAEHFGNRAEPIRERLITFLSILEANGWIEWKEP